MPIPYSLHISYSVSDHFFVFTQASFCLCLNLSLSGACKQGAIAFSLSGPLFTRLS